MRLHKTASSALTSVLGEKGENLMQDMDKLRHRRFLILSALSLAFPEPSFTEGGP